MKKILLMTALSLPSSMVLAQEMVQTTTEVDNSPIKSVTIEAPADLKPVQVKVFPADNYQSKTSEVSSQTPSVPETPPKPCRTVKAIIEIQCPECDICIPSIPVEVVKKPEALPKCEPCAEQLLPKAEPKEAKPEIKEPEQVKTAPAKKKVAAPEAKKKVKAKSTQKKKVSLQKKLAWKKPTTKPKIMAKPIFSEPAPLLAEPVTVVVKEEIVKETIVMPVITEQAVSSVPQTPLKVKPEGNLEVSLAKVVGGMDLQTRLEGLREVKKFAEYDKECHERIECMLEKFLQLRAAKTTGNAISVQECGTDIEAALYVLGMVRNPANPLNLSNLDFSNIMIKADTLEGINFANSSFAGSTIKGTSFKKTNLTNADFIKSFLLNVDMQSSVLNNAVFGAATLQNVDFTGASLNGATFKLAKIKSSVFDKVSASDALFVDALIEESGFVLANLTGADFNHAILVKDSFKGANLTNTVFYQAQLEKVKFYDAVFKNLNGKDTDFQDTDGISIDMLLTALTDSNTVAPSMLSTSFNQVRVQEAGYWNCSKKECQVRLKDVKNYLPALLDNSLRVLSGAHETAGNRAWALCNIKCVLNEDASRSDYALGEVADFVKKRAPWPPRTNRRAAATAPDIDVQAAIYVIGSRPEGAMKTSVDLTNTDLRGADFYNMDMSGVDFKGSNLRGALVTNSKGLPPDLSSTIVRK